MNYVANLIEFNGNVLKIQIEFPLFDILMPAKIDTIKWSKGTIEDLAPSLPPRRFRRIQKVLFPHPIVLWYKEVDENS